MNLERHGELAVLAMNTGKANAISAEFIRQLDRAREDFAKSDARALVVTGYDRFFSAGLDLPSLVGLERPELGDFVRRFDAAMLRWWDLPRPVVAAINGHAIAGGCVIALQADLRLMADGPGRIGLAEVSLGIGLPASVIETLRAQVPSSSLGPIALEGRLLAPRDALALGLVHEVVAPDALQERALARARELAALPPAAFAMIKASIRRPVTERVRSTVEHETAAWLTTWFSPEARSRVAAQVARLAKP